MSVKTPPERHSLSRGGVFYSKFLIPDQEGNDLFLLRTIRAFLCTLIFTVISFSHFLLRLNQMITPMMISTTGSAMARLMPRIDAAYALTVSVVSS